VPPPLSPLAARIRVGAAEAWRPHERAVARLRAGEDVIVLSLGDPDFVTPEPIVEAAVDSLRGGRTHYTAARGERELLVAIADRAGRDAGEPVDVARVVFLPGAQAALHAVISCVAGDGDEVLVPEPAYATYEGVVAAAGARMVHVPLRAERGFHLLADDVAAAVTPHTRAVLVNTPHNPTGAAMTADELAALAAVCAAHDLWLVSDEVYAALTFARPHASALAAPGATERVAVVSSLSKSHAMTGFRHGWAIVPPALAEAIDLLLQSMLFGSPPFVQDAGLAALRHGDAASASMRVAYERRARVVVDALAATPGVVARMPEAGMFVLADVRGCGLDGTGFADRLLDEEAVSLLPVDPFGPSGAGHVRIGLAASEARLAEACRRIDALARRLAG
jgi:arginine:pyruvate transaminase